MIKLPFTFIFFLLFIISGSLYAQEVCDNGIDDDGDGQIDLNDDECLCTAFIESSLIPNPSFEEMTCCPNANEMLQCAVDWIQASAATSDYVHTCEGYLGNTSIPAVAPLPFPDGEGGVGFRDGQEFAGNDYKEYVGACLTEPMVVGVEYRLDFFVGFQDNVSGSTSFDIAFFGSTNCNNLPFGGGNFNIGCPLNTGNYVQLAEQTVSGSNEWVNVVVEFVADQPYEVLVLGPSCALNPLYYLDPYFYVDRLALEEVGEFGVPLDEVSGSICEDDLVLSVEYDPAYSYQWYKDGIALVGETSNSILLQAAIGVEGFYIVAIITDEGCLLSKEYEVRIPPYYAPVDALICENENFIVGTDSINQSGYYEITIPAADGCDSIVQLTLEVNPNSLSLLQDYFCEGDEYSYYDLSTSEGGSYEVIIPNENGCDSIVHLELSMITQSIGVEMAPLIEVPLGEYLNISPDYYDPNLVYFNWYNEADQLISENVVLENFQAFDNTTLYLGSSDQYGCVSIDTVDIRVDKSNIRLYIPNAFSPDGNGINDFFRYYSSIALEEIEMFAIYDRWGGNVFKAEKIVGDEYFQGWDGTIKGEKAAIGVYAYYIKARFLDGTEEIFKGDVTLFK